MINPADGRKPKPAKKLYFLFFFYHPIFVSILTLFYPAGQMCLMWKRNLRWFFCVCTFSPKKPRRERGWSRCHFTAVKLGLKFQSQLSKIKSTLLPLSAWKLVQTLFLFFRAVLSDSQKGQDHISAIYLVWFCTKERICRCHI